MIDDKRTIEIKEIRYDRDVFDCSGHYYRAIATDGVSARYRTGWVSNELKEDMEVFKKILMQDFEQDYGKDG